MADKPKPTDPSSRFIETDPNWLKPVKPTPPGSDEQAKKKAAAAKATAEAALQKDNKE
jgi:hypothetical protein